MACFICKFSSQPRTSRNSCSILRSKTKLIGTWQSLFPLTWFPLEEVLSLNGGDLGHSGEDVSAVGSGSLHAVAMIDLPLACFLVHIELGRKRGESGSGGLDCSPEGGWDWQLDSEYRIWAAPVGVRKRFRVCPGV